MQTRETKWHDNYRKLAEYVELHHQLPDKKKVGNRGLLNWWKYNKKRMKDGYLEAEKTILLKNLSDMRHVHQ